MLDVLNNFMKNLFTVKSSDCRDLLSKLYGLRAHITKLVNISALRAV